LRNDSHRLRKTGILDLAHKAEDVTRLPAPEAVVKLPSGMNRKRRRFFLMKRAQTRVVLRPSLAQANISADDLDDVSLLLDGLGKIGHGQISE
jgi:hypothetical protein